MEVVTSKLHELDVWFAESFHAAYVPSSTHYLNTATPQLPFAAVIAYLIFVFLARKFYPSLSREELAKRPKTFIDSIMKVVVPVWDLGLSAVSILIVIGVGLPWFRMVQEHGFWHMYCDPDHLTYKGSTGLMFWAYVFALSKYWELFDTLWLVLKRKPVIFLHWYHHCTVLLFTWFAEYWRFSMGVIFIIVNASVHTIMYFYYFMSGLHYRFPTWVPFSITIIQITQMFIGIGTNAYWAYLYFQGESCCNEAPVILMTSAVIMYGSYLFLFVQFFFRRYFGSSKPVAGGAKKASNNNNAATNNATTTTNNNNNNNNNNNSVKSSRAKKLE